ncbi:hypothetical protein ACTTBA_15000 [Shewanella frigidimarina]|uniref:hypothetical protein n=1 Tax=Shewanella frigidimarina TaxID=56812 RepID=UPI003F9F6E24
MRLLRKQTKCVIKLSDFQPKAHLIQSLVKCLKVFPREATRVMLYKVSQNVSFAP